MSSCQCGRPVVILNTSGGSITTIYTANATLLSDRTVTANNNDLTFNMGSGSFTVNGLVTVSGLDLMTLSSNPGDSNTLWASGNNLYIGDQNLSLKISNDAGNIVVFGSDSGIFLDATIICNTLNNCTISQLSDVTSTVAVSGNLLTYNGSAWTPMSASIDVMSDVYLITSPTTGQSLIWSPVYSAFIPGNVMQTLSISGNGATQTITTSDTLKFAASGDLSLGVASDTVTYGFVETTTTLSYNSGTRILSYVDENAATTNLSLSGLIFTCSNLNSCSIDALSDVSTSGAAYNQVLTFNGTNWVPQDNAAFSCAELGICSVGSLADVVLFGTPTNGDVLAWSPVYSSFIPTAPFSYFRVSDGVNSQTILNANTVTFNGSGNVDIAVHATDQVTIGYTEELTTLSFNSGTNTLTYVDEHGVSTNLSLTSAASFSCSSLNSCSVEQLSDVIYPSAPTNGTVMTWSTVYGGWIPSTPFSSFSISGGGGSQTISNGNTITFSGVNNVDVVVSATDLVSISYTDVVTTLVYNTGTNVLTYTDESGGTTALTIFDCTDLNACSIDALSDVSTAGVTNGQVLAYNGSSWVPTTVTVSGGGSFTCLSLSGCSVSSMSDVTYPSAPSDGNVLTWSTAYSGWIPSTPFSSFTISGGGTTQTISNGNTLSFSGVGRAYVNVSATDRVSIGYNETLTTLTYDSGLNRLTYVDESGTSSVINLMSFTGGGSFLCSSLNLCSIDNLSDVVLAGPTHGQMLIWDSGYSAFANADNPSFFSISDGHGNTQVIATGNTLTFSGAGNVGVAVSGTDRLTISYDEVLTTFGSVSGQYLRYTDESGVQTDVDICVLLNGCEINSLGNVSGTPSTNDILTWNGTSWTPAVAPGGGGFVCSDLNACSITALSDVSGTPSASQVLAWDNSLSVYKPSGVMGSFTITDGFNPQSITNANTITFAAVGDLTVATSATDTVTYTFNETTTTLSYNTGTRVLAYTDEDGSTTNITLPSGFSCSGLNTCSIDALSDVNTAGVVSGNFLKYNGSAWIPSNVSAGVSADAGNDLTLGSDSLPYLAETVTALTTSGTSYLKYTNEAGASNTINICTLISGCNLNAFGDVDITSATSNQILRWNGSAWVNSDENVAGSYSFTISDGTTTQTIATGNTLTFADSNCINATVSATDTVTFSPIVAPPVTLTDISGNTEEFANALQCTSSGLFVPCIEVIEPTITGTGSEKLTLRVGCGSTWEEYSIPWFDDVKRVGEDALTIAHGDPVEADQHGADLLIDSNTGELFYHTVSDTWDKVNGTYGYTATTAFTAGVAQTITHNLDNPYVIVQVYLDTVSYDELVQPTIRMINDSQVSITTSITGDYKVCILPVFNMI